MSGAATKPLEGIRAVGFDIGNTLVEYRGIPLSWQSLYRVALTDAAAALDREVDEDGMRAAEEILARYNTRLHPREHEVSYREIFGAILEAWVVPADFVEDAAQAFFAHFNREAQLFADTVPVLTALNSRGLRCGLLTDLPYGMNPDLTREQIAPIRHLVGALVTSTEIGFRKPAPPGYLELCQELGVAPAETVYVGDEPKDAIGAVRAGLVPVLIDRSPAGNPGSDLSVVAGSGLAGVRVIRSLHQLLRLLPGD